MTAAYVHGLMVDLLAFRKRSQLFPQFVDSATPPRAFRRPSFACAWPRDRAWARLVTAVELLAVEPDRALAEGRVRDAKRALSDLGVDINDVAVCAAAPETFEERVAAFVAGLCALTRQTGVAVTSTAALGAWNQIEMVDAADYPRGQYLRDKTDLEWVRNEDDYAEPMPWGDKGARHGRGASDALDAEMFQESAVATDAAGKALFEALKGGS